MTTETPVTSTDETKVSKHLVLIGRIILPILGLLTLWGAKTVAVILSSVNVKEAMENSPEATVQTIFVWIAFFIIAILTYKVGVRLKIWGSARARETTKGRADSYSASAYRDRREGKRFSLAAAVWTLVGLSIAGFMIVKILQEIDYGLSNAPERMAERGYVPRESVAAALAAAAPALPEVHIITAPPLSADGKTNWSEPLIRKKSPHSILSFTAGEEMDPWVETMVDGKAGLKMSDHGTGIMVRFRSLTNHPIKITTVEQVF